MATIADQIVDTLATAGVKRIWGVVGDSLNGFTDALRRHGGITWMRVSMKEAGAFAAAGEAAVSGKLAVCAGSCGLGQPAPDQRHLRRPPLAGAGGRDRRPDPLAQDRFRLRGVARDAAVRRRLPGRLLQAPMVHALGGKEPVEPDNPYDVGMTGLIGFSSGYHALRECVTLLMQGTDFPYPQFYPEHARMAQVDVRPGVIGRRTAVEIEVIGDVRSTFRALLPRLKPKDDGTFLKKAQEALPRSAQGTGRPGAGQVRRRRPSPYVARVASELATANAGLHLRCRPSHSMSGAPP